MSKIDTFSANSLKILDRDIEEFKNKYVYNLTLFKKDKRAESGQKFHSLICSYIKGFNIEKLLLNLDNNEFDYWKKLKPLLEDKKEDFIKTEYSFLIKENLEQKNYYLTGRFDAIYKESKEDKKDDSYIIYDWKTLNLPQNVEDDLQTIVYLYSASKIFKSEKIKIRYLSIEKLETIETGFLSSIEYKKRIDNIVKKII